MTYLTEKLNFTKQSIKEMQINSKNFYNEIKKRRSIRNFENKGFNVNIIKNAIRAASTSPNGANLQPWHFVIITKDKIKKEIRIAAEKEEEEFYNNRAPIEWLEALKPLGKSSEKKFIEDPSHSATLPSVTGNKEDPNRMFMFTHNQCHPDCCPSTYTCDRVCVCTTEAQRDFIAKRGLSRTSDIYPGI